MLSQRQTQKFSQNCCYCRRRRRRFTEAKVNPPILTHRCRRRGLPISYFLFPAHYNLRLASLPALTVFATLHTVALCVYVCLRQTPSKVRHIVGRENGNAAASIHHDELCKLSATRKDRSLGAGRMTCLAWPSLNGEHLGNNDQLRPGEQGGSRQSGCAVRFQPLNKSSAPEDGQILSNSKAKQETTRPRLLAFLHFHRSPTQVQCSSKLG